jgi:hypothetical protein
MERLTRQPSPHLAKEICWQVVGKIRPNGVKIFQETGEKYHE